MQETMLEFARPACASTASTCPTPTSRAAAASSGSVAPAAASTRAARPSRRRRKPVRTSSRTPCPAAGCASARRRSGGLVRRLALAAVGAAGLVAVAAVAAVTVGSGSSSAEAATPDGAAATVEVERRDLVLRDDVDGTLGYADARTLTAGARGVVTRLRDEGTVVTRGRLLYEVNAEGVRLLYGTMPLWRRLGPRVSDGRDVEQLERNLVELGHDPQGMTVDETFDADTAAAVRSWQDALGLPETGAVEPDDAVFLPGPRRIGQLETTVGAQVQPGASRARGDRDVARRRDRPRRARARSSRGSARRCASSSPPGAASTGTVASVGRVAETSTTPTGETGDPTVSVVVRLADPGERDGLDGAPVTVSLERDRARNVLAVPVEALLALRGGGERCRGRRLERRADAHRGRDRHVRRRLRRGDGARDQGRRAGGGARVSAVLEARSLEKRYGADVAALQGVSVTIEEGELLAIVGPSGSGKSTLLHVLGTLERPTAGALRIAGHEASRASPTARSPRCGRARSASSSSSSSCSTVAPRSTTSPTASSTAAGPLAERRAAGARGARAGRARPPPRPPAQPAVRRRAAAGRRRTGDRRRAADPLRGRADREPRHGLRARRSSSSSAS